MKNWFTADTHFGQERTLELSKRPFKNVKDMDDCIIGNWNDIVKENNLINHLGDFGDYTMVKKLNGKVRLIMGNYEWADVKNKFNNNLEEFKKHLIELGFFEIIPYKTYVAPMLKDFKMVCLCHEPENSHIEKNVFNLFAHVHKLSMVKRNGLNVGVDCHNFYPIDLDTIEFYKNAIQNHYDENVFM